MRRITLVSIIVLATAGAIAAAAAVRQDWRGQVVGPVQSVLARDFTVQQRMDQYAAGVARRLAPSFAAAGVSYPPHEVAYIALKDRRTLDLYARSASAEPWRFVKRYPVLAASGIAGPKLKEGDRQVPEGIYHAEFLNANSRFHLSIRLNYPNQFDRRMAERDGRTQLGGDIMIHGNAVSIGCLAMGDPGAEELFVLSALATPARTHIVVSPTDFRTGGTVSTQGKPAWTGELYDSLRAELAQFPPAPHLAVAATL